MPPTMMTRAAKRRRVEDQFLDALTVVAADGWFPWWQAAFTTSSSSADGNGEHDGVTGSHAALRLVSKTVRDLVDRPSHGGADFDKIWELLDNRNRFDIGAGEHGGYCAHCYALGGMSSDAPDDEPPCEACEKNSYYEDCSCEKDHRFEPVVRAMDPRLLNEEDFQAMPLRERVARLLRFHRWCVSNFLQKKGFTTVHGGDADLTEVDPNMWQGRSGLCAEMERFNPKTHAFLHNLLFVGWAHKGLSLSVVPPGTYDPYRHYLLGQDDDYWNGGHRDTFHEISTSFFECHRPAPGEEPLEPDEWNFYLGHGLALSQIQHIPETIRRCVDHSRDAEAVRLLGDRLASSIDLYRPARATLRKYEGTGELDIQWMPGLGMPREAYVPLSSYEGYNPRCEHVAGTGLQTVLEPSGQPEE